MESELILEAFKGSEKDMGVRFVKVIADGDSKTFKAITDAKIYMNPPVNLEKVECRIHLYRCAYGRLTKLKFLSSAKIERLINGVQCARKHWAEMDLPFHEMANKLRQNIVCVPHHVFGNHSKCDSYYCDFNKHKSDVNFIPDMENSGELQKIYEAMGRLLDNVPSLLLNYDTNRVECFNSVLVKHNGGKRVNFTAAGSQTGRNDTSVIDFNTKHLGSSILKHKLDISENELNEKLIFKLETKRANRNLIQNANRRSFHKSTYRPDDNYGTDTCEQLELDAESFECRKSFFLEFLRLHQTNRLITERATIGKVYSDLWKQIHSQVINAPEFGQICRARSVESSNLFTNVISDAKKNTVESRYEKNLETDVIEQVKQLGQQVEDLTGLEYHECGIFVDEKFEFLGATPDRLINEDGILTIKCPYKAKDMNIEEAIAEKIINFWTTTKPPRKRSVKIAADNSNVKIENCRKRTKKSAEETEVVPKKKSKPTPKMPKAKKLKCTKDEDIVQAVENDSTIQSGNFNSNHDDENSDPNLIHFPDISNDRDNARDSKSLEGPACKRRKITKNVSIGSSRKSSSNEQSVTHDLENTRDEHGQKLDHDNKPTKRQNLRKMTKKKVDSSIPETKQQLSKPKSFNPQSMGKSSEKPVRKAYKRNSNCEKPPNDSNGEVGEIEKFKPTITGINKASKWYYQIQGELHITKRSYCLLAVRTNKEIKTQRIERDDAFWANQVEAKLMAFFNNAFLPGMIQSKR